MSTRMKYLFHFIFNFSIRWRCEGWEKLWSLVSRHFHFPFYVHKMDKKKVKWNFFFYSVKIEGCAKITFVKAELWIRLGNLNYSWIKFYGYKQLFFFNNFLGLKNFFRKTFWFVQIIPLNEPHEHLFVWIKLHLF